LVVFHDRQTILDGMIEHVFFSQWQNRCFWPVQVLYVQLITFRKREPPLDPSGVKTKWELVALRPHRTHPLVKFKMRIAT